MAVFFYGNKGTVTVDHDARNDRVDINAADLFFDPARMKIVTTGEPVPVLSNGQSFAFKLDEKFDFKEFGENIADASDSFKRFSESIERDIEFPPVFEWLSLAQIGRTIMTLRLDSGRLMTTRPRWEHDAPWQRGSLIGEFLVTREGRVIGVVISDDHGNLLLADDLDLTLTPGEDLVVTLPVGFE